MQYFIALGIFVFLETCTNLLTILKKMLKQTAKGHHLHQVLRRHSLRIGMPGHPPRISLRTCNYSQLNAEPVLESNGILESEQYGPLKMRPNRGLGEAVPRVLRLHPCFSNLKTFLIDFFPKGSSSQYSRCSLLEKQLVKILLNKKFGKLRCMQTSANPDSDQPLGTELVQTLSNRSSLKRPFDMARYLVKSFIDFEFGKFKRSKFLLAKLTKTEQLHAKKWFFETLFPEHTKRGAQEMPLISVFVKINKHASLRRELLERSLHRPWKDNCTYKNQIRVIESEPTMRHKLRTFLQVGRNCEVGDWFTAQIQKSVSSLVDSMQKMHRQSQILAEHSPGVFVKEFKQIMSKLNRRLPTLMTDIEHHSRLLLNQLKNN